MAICFYNDGLLDLRFVTTFGASKKVGDNPIGYFGTGLKYAIAVLLRDGHSISLYIGRDEHKFGIKETDIRGSTFKIVTMDGEEMPFTTELGKNWETWMAFRELYSNALDENGGTKRKLMPKGRDGMTIIAANGRKIEGCFDNRASIILNGTAPLSEDSYARRLSGTSRWLFYRGVRVTRIPPALFTWSIQTECDLTEDRTLKYDWQGCDAIAHHILKSSDRNLISACVTAPEQSFEWGLDYASYVTGGPSPEFLDTVQGLTARGAKVAAKAQQITERNLGMLTPETTDLTSVERQKLDRAKHIVRQLGGRPEDFPIRITLSLGQGVYGRAHKGEIWLAKFAFEQGVKMLASTLYEEWVHLQYGYDDLSRPMQNFLFERLLTMLEEHVLGEPI